MNDLVSRIITHLIVWVLLFCAFALNIDGAVNVVKFYVWVAVMLSPFLLVNEVIVESAKTELYPLFRWFCWLQIFVTLILLVWFGHIITAIAYCIGSIIAAVAEIKTDEYLES